MPHLMVDIEDMADCRKAIEILKRRLNHECRPRRHRRRGEESREFDVQSVGNFDAGGEGRRAGRKEDVASLPLPQKLKRIQSRGMWKHLLKIAQSAEQPLSLPELDNLLGLHKNKMRSLKAIMAKLENRFDLQFLKVDSEAGEDAAGNPRYIMPLRLRRQILRLATE